MDDPTARLDAAGVIDRLETHRPEGPFGLAFDADGTLWSGDVGEDVFTHAVENRLLTSAAEGALREVAQEHGLTGEGAAGLAAAIFHGYLAGRVPELRVCEVMTWCYAGMTLADLAAIAQEALENRGLAGRVRTLLRPILQWAERRHARVVVISASPESIVRVALQQAHVSVDDLSAAVPRIERNLIQTAMAAPLPYGPVKRTVGLRLLSGRYWLGSFGDNLFDRDMLGAARIGVAVCPKPALATRLFELPNTVVLE
jgi:phosphatidylglycerophosphatase C